jgi:hypothetical protein
MNVPCCLKNFLGVKDHNGGIGVRLKIKKQVVKTTCGSHEKTSIDNFKKSEDVVFQKNSPE